MPISVAEAVKMEIDRSASNAPSSSSDDTTATTTDPSSASSSSSSNSKITFAFAAGKRKPRAEMPVQLHETKENKAVTVTTLRQDTLSKIAASSGKKQVVVPLIEKNQYEIPPMILELQAEEAREREAARGGVKVEQSDMELGDAKAVPLIMQNVVPGMERLVDEKKRFDLDVLARPDAPSQDAYDNVSVEDFGKAVLYGMGWKPGAPIGKTNKVAVDPIEFIPRAHRLGLGASEGVPSDKPKKKFIKPGETRDEQQFQRVAPDADGKVRHFRKLNERLIPVHSRQLRVDALVEFIGGPHRRLYGRVTEVGEGKSSVRLNLSDQVVQSPNDYFQVLDERALPTDHPAFDKKPRPPTPPPASAARSKSKSPKRRDEKRRGGDRSRSRSRGKDKRRDKDDDRRRRRSRSRSRSRSPKRAKAVPPITWVTAGIRVRINSTEFARGKYYTKKGRVADVNDRYRFSVYMDDDNSFVEGLTQADVETALPKVGGRVMVLSGPHKGTQGTLLERSSSKGKAVVQVEGDLDLVTCSLDDVAEFVGL